MQLARTEAAYASDGKRFYVIAGFAPSVANTPTVEVYDVEADEWSMGPPLPVPLNHAMAAVLDGEVYVFGGYSALVVGAVNLGWVLRGGSWQPLAPMPETRAAAGVTVHRGKVYLIGGFSQQGILATSTLIYDPESGTWETAPPPPTLREHLTAASDGRYIYAIGGRTGSPATNMTTVERLDPRTGKWSDRRGMLVARSGHASAVSDNGYIVALGGEGLGSIFSAAEAYHIRRDKWVPLPPLDPGRTGAGAAAVGSRVYAFFGASDAGYLATTESFDLRELRRR